VVAAGEAVRVPDGLSLEEAAAVPEVFITAQDALATRLCLAPGEALLIHAVGSGVGTAALQLARAWGGRVLGTSRTGWKLDRARELGLDLAMETDDGRFADRVMEATDGRGVDAILDLVGGGYLEENLRSLATLGRQVVVGLTAGRTATLDLGALLRKRLTLVGTVLRSRPGPERLAVARAFADDVVPLLADGRVRPVIHAILPAADAARAHALVESNQTFGKVVLTW
jgi:NADPH:quinone reductase